METNIQQVNLITIIILIGSVIFHYILFLKNNSEAKEKKASTKGTNKSSAYKAITVPHAFETQYLKACSTNELDNEENTNLDVIKNSDWIIDLGPEGGENGGTIIGEGTPESISKNKFSLTGKHLKEVLNGKN